MYVDSPIYTGAPKVMQWSKTLYIYSTKKSREAENVLVLTSMELNIFMVDIFLWINEILEKMC